MPIVVCESGGVMAYRQDGSWAGWYPDPASARRKLRDLDISVPASSSVAPGLPAFPGGPAAGSTSPDSAAT
jgi:hypothetical protein